MIGWFGTPVSRGTDLDLLATRDCNPIRHETILCDVY
jgi:hypothetical protein